MVYFFCFKAPPRSDKNAVSDVLENKTSPTMKGHYSEPEETNRPLPNIELGNYDVPKSWPTPPKFSEPGAPPGPPIQWQPNTPQTADAGYGYVPAAEPEREVFFYHSDHLGSTAYITDRNGAVSQFICYMPYGEALVDEHSSVTEEQPYKFNGKEMDRETGLYYYGARYYDPSKSGVWYGVDPLAEKKPWLSPYVYCSANPIRFIDPDGRDEWELNQKGEIKNRIATKEHDSFHIIDADGKRIEGKEIKFQAKTVTKQETEKTTKRFPTNQQGIEYDKYKIKGDKNAKELFEFLANNTVVEWSHAKVGKGGDDGINFMTTTHEKNRELGMSALISNELWNGYFVREFNHNHPQNSPIPSGSSGITHTKGDIQFAKDVVKIFGENIKFNIYTPKDKRYISFGPNSK